MRSPPRAPGTHDRDQQARVRGRVPEDCTGATKYSNYEAAVEMVTMQGGVFGAVASSDALIEALTPLAAAAAR